MQKLCRLLAFSFAITFAPMNWADSVTAVDPLAFGTFTAGAGTVTINAVTGQRSATGGVKLMSSSSVTAAAFTIDGNNSGKAKDSKSYSLASIGCGAGSMTGSGNPIGVSGFNSDTAGFIAGSKIALPKSRIATVKVGATATVAAKQASGLYGCPLNLIVDFYDR